MIKKDDFKELSRGYYRYVIAAKVCYEILYTYEKEEYLECQAYITGDWINEHNEKYFTRELLCEGSLEKCMDAINRDNEEYNKF